MASWKITILDKRCIFKWLLPSSHEVFGGVFEAQPGSPVHHWGDIWDEEMIRPSFFLKSDPEFAVTKRQSQI